VEAAALIKHFSYLNAIFNSNRLNHYFEERTQKYFEIIKLNKEHFNFFA